MPPYAEIPSPHPTPVSRCPGPGSLLCACQLLLAALVASAQLTTLYVPARAVPGLMAHSAATSAITPFALIAGAAGTQLQTSDPRLDRVEIVEIYERASSG